MFSATLSSIMDVFPIPYIIECLLEVPGFSESMDNVSTIETRARASETRLDTEISIFPEVSRDQWNSHSMASSRTMSKFHKSYGFLCATSAETIPALVTRELSERLLTVPFQQLDSID